jgi:hypothetical protein
MQLTTIEQTRSTAALKALTLALYPSLQWRHHGIGVLQGYVTEDTEPEIRIHIWAPELVLPNMDKSGDIHDHRFNLVSHVLCGHIGHEEIYPEENPQGDWVMLKLTHARAAKETGYHGPTEPIKGRYTLRRNAFIIANGYTYKYPIGRFHRSPVLPHQDIAITCVEKHGQTNDAARLLYPRNTEPVLAFGHAMDWKVVGPVLQRARELLSK